MEPATGVAIIGRYFRSLALPFFGPIMLGHFVHQFADRRCGDFYDVAG
jgi:hypothetical protein